MKRAQTWPPEGCVRFAYPFCGQGSRQNVRPEQECLPGAPATLAVGSETHSDGNRDRCEIRCVSPCQPNFGWSQLPAERPLGASERCPGARIAVLAGHAAVWAAVPAEYLRLHPGKASPCQPI